MLQEKVVLCKFSEQLPVQVMMPRLWRKCSIEWKSTAEINKGFKNCSDVSQASRKETAQCYNTEKEKPSKSEWFLKDLQLF